MTCAPASSASMASRKWEVGGVVTWTTSGRTSRSMARWSVKKEGSPNRSAAHSATEGERSQTAATSTPASPRRHDKCCRAICPAPINAAFTGSPCWERFSHGLPTSGKVGPTPGDTNRRWRGSSCPRRDPLGEDFPIELVQGGACGAPCVTRDGELPRRLPQALGETRFLEEPHHRVRKP